MNLVNVYYTTTHFSLALGLYTQYRKEATQIDIL